MFQRAHTRTRGCWAVATTASFAYRVANAKRRGWRGRVLNQHFVDEWDCLLDDVYQRNELPAVQQGVEVWAQLGRPFVPSGELLRQSVEALLRVGWGSR